MNRHYAGTLTLTALVVLTGVGALRAQGIDTPDPVLPPLDGVYRTPDQVHAQFNGPGLTIILQKPEHQAILRELNMPIGLDEKETFGSRLSAEVNVNGGPFVPATGNGPVMTLVHNKVGNTTGTFQTEMLSMDLSGNSPFGPFMIRESPTLPSLGQTTISPIGGGLYHIDSFFDVFTELSLDGGQTWMPDVQGPARVELGPSIPEPASIALVALGLVVMVGGVRRRG
jgi:hypothetical protein